MPLEHRGCVCIVGCVWGALCHHQQGSINNPVGYAQGSRRGSGVAPRETQPGSRRHRDMWGHKTYRHGASRTQKRVMGSRDANRWLGGPVWGWPRAVSPCPSTQDMLEWHRAAGHLTREPNSGPWGRGGRGQMAHVLRWGLAGGLGLNFALRVRIIDVAAHGSRVHSCRKSWKSNGEGQGKHPYPGASRPHSPLGPKRIP